MTRLNDNYMVCDRCGSELNVPVGQTVVDFTLQMDHNTGQVLDICSRCSGGPVFPTFLDSGMVPTIEEHDVNRAKS